MTTFANWIGGTIAARVTPGVAFTLASGDSFPANWLDRTTPAEQAAYNLFPIAYTNSSGDPRYYSSAEGAPTLSGGQVVMTWALTPLALPALFVNKTAALRVAASVALGAGLTVGAHRYNTDPLSLQTARSAIQDVLNGATSTSFLQDVSGAMVAVTTGNVNVARNALASFFFNICNFENLLLAQITTLTASGNTSGLINLDIADGWPTS